MSTDEERWGRHLASKAAMTGEEWPGEPAKREPRTWAMPVIPDHVTAVTDGDGVRWTRERDVRGWVADDDDDALGIDDDELIMNFGPLTEVVDGTGEAP